MTAETVLITGAASGIGRATARQFAEDGWTVYATDVDESDLAELDCRTDELDVRRGEDVDRVVDRIVDEEGSIDCLVNNAGYAQFGAVEDVPTDVLHRQFDVNVYGPHRLTRAILPHMRDREAGTVITVSSILGRVTPPGSGIYSGSKCALEAMSDALRREVEPLGIDVVLVEPGPVDTDFFDQADDELQEGIERRPDYDWVYDFLDDTILLSDGGPLTVSAEDVATTVHDAASVSDPDPRYVVGRTARYLLYLGSLPDSMEDALVRLLRRVT